MIDLHCHILPGIDDGSPDLATSLEMARIADADGIRVVACTPHITPGVYDNTGPEIMEAVDRLSLALQDAGIELLLLPGADVHLAPGLVSSLDSGHVPSLGGGRYFLLEPPHHVAPPRLEEVVVELLAEGYVPIVTHPERLSWVEQQYGLVKRLFAAGAWVQITASSITGRFGRRPRYWAERMLDERMVHVIATDAHNTGRRRPELSEARDLVADRLGPEEAEQVVLTRPLGILKNLAPSDMVMPYDDLHSAEAG